MLASELPLAPHCPMAQQMRLRLLLLLLLLDRPAVLAPVLVLVIHRRLRQRPPRIQSPRQTTQSMQAKLRPPSTMMGKGSSSAAARVTCPTLTVPTRSFFASCLGMCWQMPTRMARWPPRHPASIGSGAPPRSSSALARHGPISCSFRRWTCMTDTLTLRSPLWAWKGCTSRGPVASRMAVLCTGIRISGDWNGSTVLISTILRSPMPQSTVGRPRITRATTWHSSSSCTRRARLGSSLWWRRQGTCTGRRRTMR
mmetsp:Transcript_20350/g.65068  ORF Transcript_20350/g.65068 Transcript_20350/m.65068 type:complete len:255 (+) Transcript_20350:77-841(+)